MADGVFIGKQAAIDAVCAGCSDKLRNLCAVEGQCPNVRRLQAIPPTNVVEVVRCEDCVACIDGFICKNGQFGGRTFPNNFCSDGERKGNSG